MTYDPCVLFFVAWGVAVRCRVWRLSRLFLSVMKCWWDPFGVFERTDPGIFFAAGLDGGGMEPSRSAVFHGPRVCGGLVLRPGLSGEQVGMKNAYDRWQDSHTNGGI